MIRWWVCIEAEIPKTPHGGLEKHNTKRYPQRKSPMT
jgi:hypothetical protein